MAQKIKLVSGDTRPYITLTLTGEDGVTPIDITDATVAVAFRAAGTTLVLSTLACTALTPLEGICRFNFPSPALDVPAGNYEGEVEITFSDLSKQTIYDILKFSVREQFA